MVDLDSSPIIYTACMYTHTYKRKRIINEARAALSSKMKLICEEDEEKTRLLFQDGWSHHRREG